MSSSGRTREEEEARENTSHNSQAASPWSNSLRPLTLAYPNGHAHDDGEPEYVQGEQHTHHRAEEDVHGNLREGG